MIEVLHNSFYNKQWKVIQMYFDFTYLLVVAGALLCTFASSNVSSTFQKYSREFSGRGMRAEDVAKHILNSAGIFDVRVERIAGNLTDHYSPNEKVLRLSDSVYGSTSIAAIGVAAHACGHAIQHQVNYGPLQLRSISVPVANIGSKLYWPVIIIGLLMGFPTIAKLGVFLFMFVVFFQLITLPVEFNASKRALQILRNDNILVSNELGAARKVLNAAALTYVASLVSSLLTMLRLILITRRSDRS